MVYGAKAWSAARVYELSADGGAGTSEDSRQTQ